MKKWMSTVLVFVMALGIAMTAAPSQAEAGSFFLSTPSFGLRLGNRQRFSRNRRLFIGNNNFLIQQQLLRQQILRQQLLQQQLLRQQSFGGGFGGGLGLGSGCGF